MTILQTSMIIRVSVADSNINMAEIMVNVAYVVILLMPGHGNMKLLVADLPMVSSHVSINLVKILLSRLMSQPTTKDISCSSCVPITTQFRIQAKVVLTRLF